MTSSCDSCRLMGDNVTNLLNCVERCFWHGYGGTSCFRIVDDTRKTSVAAVSDHDWQPPWILRRFTSGRPCNPQIYTVSILICDKYKYNQNSCVSFVRLKALWCMVYQLIWNQEIFWQPSWILSIYIILPYFTIKSIHLEAIFVNLW